MYLIVTLYTRNRVNWGITVFTKSTTTSSSHPDFTISNTNSSHRPSLLPYSTLAIISIPLLSPFLWPRCSRVQPFHPTRSRNTGETIRRDRGNEIRKGKIPASEHTALWETDITYANLSPGDQKERHNRSSPPFARQRKRPANLSIAWPTNTVNTTNTANARDGKVTLVYYSLGVPVQYKIGKATALSRDSIILW